MSGLLPLMVNATARAVFCIAAMMLCVTISELRPGIFRKDKHNAMKIVVDEEKQIVHVRNHGKEQQATSAVFRDDELVSFSAHLAGAKKDINFRVVSNFAVEEAKTKALWSNIKAQEFEAANGNSLKTKCGVLVSRLNVSHSFSEENLYGLCENNSRNFEQDPQYSTAAYSLGDLFNMPSYSVKHSWPKYLESATGLVSDGKGKGMKTNSSIFALYYDSFFELPNSRHPNVTRLRLTVKRFGESVLLGRNSFNDHFGLVRENTTLLVHVRSGDSGPISDKFVTCVIDVSTSFKLTILMAGVHNDTRFKSKRRALNYVAEDFTRILAGGINAGLKMRIHYGKDPDADAYLMSVASNLLLHRGGFSALGGILNRKTTFFQEEMDHYLNNTEYFSLLSNPLRTC